MRNAGFALQGSDFPSGLVGTLQGLILFTAVAGEVLTKQERCMPNVKAKAISPAPVRAAETVEAAIADYITGMKHA